MKVPQRILLLVENAILQNSSIFNCFYAQNECPNKNIKFWFYRNDTSIPILIDTVNIARELFVPRLPLKFLIHGYTGDRESSPNAEIRPVLLQYEKVYVITIEYGSLVRKPCYYPWSVRNAKVVAKCLAQFLNNLILSGCQTPDDIHLIGFSLGAQVAGLTANYVRHRLKWITALDPARPAFDIRKFKEKLDPADADFIDVIHTDPFLFSYLEPLGHIDFYPNFNMHLKQPGCPPELTKCNHFRACAYYAESIISKKGFWSHYCGSYLDYMAKRCQHYANLDYVLMGYHVNKSIARGSYFLHTNSKSPFAKGHQKSRL